MFDLSSYNGRELRTEGEVRYVRLLTAVVDSEANPAVYSNKLSDSTLLTQVIHNRLRKRTTVTHTYA